RRHSEEDRREVLIELTARGEQLLRMLSVLHWEELQNSGPALSEALQAVVHNGTEDGRRLT
ncbi:MAG: MarR family transcriptional regulator, partial [Candidatus Udaeobacter sp.]